MNKHFLTILTTFILLFIIPEISQADIIGVSLKPRIPGPNQEVTASLEGYTVDLEKSNIVWYVDGEPQNTHLNGIGQRTMNFTTKGIGEKTVLDIAIFTLYGAKLDKQLIVIPIEVDLIWEAETYTPPFYKGKALPSNYSDISVMGIPHILSDDESEFIYTWTEDRFNMIKSASGYMRNVIVTQSAESPLRKYIDLEIGSLKTSAKATKRVTIPTFEPHAVMYKSSELTGTDYTMAINQSLKLTGNEVLIRAEPFNLSQKAFEDNHIKFEWSLDGKKILETNVDGLEFSFGKGNISVESRINFKATNEDDWFQMASKVFSIVY